MLPEAGLVQSRHAPPVSRPNTGDTEVVVLLPPRSLLRSSHAPAAGTATADAVARYSLTWPRCAPAKAAAQVPCAVMRPPTLPVKVAGVKPAKAKFSS